MVSRASRKELVGRISVKVKLLPHLKGDLEVDIEPGKIQVLSGENGIGKSTLLNYLAVKIPESVFCEQKNPEHFFDRTLASFRKILLKSENLDREMFDSLWKESGLGAKEDRQVMSLSGGESQLLKLIVHSTVKAQTFFFDEPGQYLDRDKKQFARDLLVRLNRQGKSVLIVEHDYQWLPAGTQITKLENENGVLLGKETWTI